MSNYSDRKLDFDFLDISYGDLMTDDPFNDDVDLKMAQYKENLKKEFNKTSNNYLNGSIDTISLGKIGLDNQLSSIKNDDQLNNLDKKSSNNYFDDNDPFRVQSIDKEDGELDFDDDVRKKTKRFKSSFEDSVNKNKFNFLSERYSSNSIQNDQIDLTDQLFNFQPKSSNHQSKSFNSQFETSNTFSFKLPTNSTSDKLNNSSIKSNNLFESSERYSNSTNNLFFGSKLSSQTNDLFVKEKSLNLKPNQMTNKKIDFNLLLNKNDNQNEISKDLFDSNNNQLLSSFFPKTLDYYRSNLSFNLPSDKSTYDFNSYLQKCPNREIKSTRAVTKVRSLNEDVFDFMNNTSIENKSSQSNKIFQPINNINNDSNRIIKFEDQKGSNNLNILSEPSQLDSKLNNQMDSSKNSNQIVNNNLLPTIKSSPAKKFELTYEKILKLQLRRKELKFWSDLAHMKPVILESYVRLELSYLNKGTNSFIIVIVRDLVERSKYKIDDDFESNKYLLVEYPDPDNKNVVQINRISNGTFTREEYKTWYETSKLNMSIMYNDEKQYESKKQEIKKALDEFKKQNLTTAPNIRNNVLSKIDKRYKELASVPVLKVPKINPAISKVNSLSKLNSSNSNVKNSDLKPTQIKRSSENEINSNPFVNSSSKRPIKNDKIIKKENSTTFDSKINKDLYKKHQNIKMDKLIPNDKTKKHQKILIEKSDLNSSIMSKSINCDKNIQKRQIIKAKRHESNVSTMSESMNYNKIKIISPPIKTERQELNGLVKSKAIDNDKIKKLQPIKTEKRDLNDLAKSKVINHDKPKKHQKIKTPDSKVFTDKVIETEKLNPDDSFSTNSINYLPNKNQTIKTDKSTNYDESKKHLKIKTVKPNSNVKNSDLKPSQIKRSSENEINSNSFVNSSSKRPISPLTLEKHQVMETNRSNFNCPKIPELMNSNKMQKNQSTQTNDIDSAISTKLEINQETINFTKTKSSTEISPIETFQSKIDKSHNYYPKTSLKLSDSESDSNDLDSETSFDKAIRRRRINELNSGKVDHLKNFQIRSRESTPLSPTDKEKSNFSNFNNFTENEISSYENESKNQHFNSVNNSKSNCEIESNIKTIKEHSISIGSDSEDSYVAELRLKLEIKKIELELLARNRKSNEFIKSDLSNETNDLGLCSKEKDKNLNKTANFGDFVFNQNSPTTKQMQCNDADLICSSNKKSIKYPIQTTTNIIHSHYENKVDQSSKDVDPSILYNANKIEECSKSIDYPMQTINNYNRNNLDQSIRNVSSNIVYNAFEIEQHSSSVKKNNIHLPKETKQLDAAIYGVCFETKKSQYNEKSNLSDSSSIETKNERSFKSENSIDNHLKISKNKKTSLSIKSIEPILSSNQQNQSFKKRRTLDSSSSSTSSETSTISETMPDRILRSNSMNQEDKRFERDFNKISYVIESSSVSSETSFINELMPQRRLSLISMNEREREMNREREKLSITSESILKRNLESNFMNEQERSGQQRRVLSKLEVLAKKAKVNIDHKNERNLQKDLTKLIKMLYEERLRNGGIDEINFVELKEQGIEYKRNEFHNTTSYKKYLLKKYETRISRNQ